MEIELKLDVAPDDVDALIAAATKAGGARRMTRLKSVYFDTPGHDLRAAGFSLRVRHIHDRRVQTIKADGGAAAGLFARGEWECDIDGDAPVLSADTSPLAQLVPPDVLQKLAPVFTTDVERGIMDVTLDGATIEMALDRGRVRAGERTLGICEVELELRQGPTAGLFALARLLDDAAPVRLGAESKSARGYRLASGASDRPNKARRVDLSADMSAATAFQAIAASSIQQFRLNEALFAGGESGDALHQARVGLRRLRSAFSLFKQLVADDATDHLRAELRWLAATLGDARDLDVLIGHHGAGEPAPPAELLEARLRSYAAVHEALASSRVRRLMLELAEWLAVGGWLSNPVMGEERTTPIPLIAAAMLDRQRRRVKKRGARLAKLGDEARHEVRIEVKKLRYAAEFFASLYPRRKERRRVKTFLAAMEELQECLGQLNDQASAPLVLARLGLPADAMPTVPALGAKRRQALLDTAEDAYDALIEARRFWR